MASVPSIPTAPAAWDPNSGAALPAHIANAMDEMGTNIPERQTVPSLSYEGKNWTVVMDGNKTKLQEKNGDGDMVPVPIMHVILLNLNNDRGRAYYPGTYNPTASTAPVCWSADGKAPDPSVTTKQSPACANCPQSVKGSKITDDGREGVACGSHRMLAVLPATDLKFRPLRLKIAVTSDFDKNVVEHGWFALRQYLDYLKSRGITHSALVVTKIKFDPNVAYPKLLFSLSRPVTEDELSEIKGLPTSPQVMDLLNEKWTAAGVDGVQTDQADMAPGASLPKPTSSDHIAYAGTPNEVWWHPAEQAWVKPWIVEQAAPPAAPPVAEPPAPAVPASQAIIDQPPAAAPVPEYDPIAAAVADGWIAHPDAASYHYKGTEVVPTADLVGRYPGNAPASAATPAASAPEPTPVSPAPTPSTGPIATTPASPSDPLDAARVDGWITHPDAAGYHYKGTEVVADEDLAARYPSTAVTTPAATAAPAPAATPSDAIPPEVQGLLDKWTGDAAPTA